MLQAIWQEGGERRLRLGPISIDPRWWREAEALEGDKNVLWQFGETDLLVVSPGRTSGYLVHFYAIRFEWGAFREVVPKPSQADETNQAYSSEEVPASEDRSEPRDNRPRLGDDPLGEWWTIFSKHNLNATEAQAIASARAMFSNHSIARDRIRELRGPQKSGPKPSAE